MLPENCPKIGWNSVNLQEPTTLQTRNSLGVDLSVSIYLVPMGILWRINTRVQNWIVFVVIRTSFGGREIDFRAFLKIRTTHRSTPRDKYVPFIQIFQRYAINGKTYDSDNYSYVISASALWIIQGILATCYAVATRLGPSDKLIESKNFTPNSSSPICTTRSCLARKDLKQIHCRCRASRNG